MKSFRSFFVLLAVPLFLVACSSSHHLGSEASQHGHAYHDHGQGVELSDSEAIPSVDLVVHEDPKSGWNLQVKTQNFIFSPQHASLDHVPGEGHAHLYVNGKKITRLYGEWYHLSDLEPGTHEVVVNLNANHHAPFLHHGQEIRDVESIVVED